MKSARHCLFALPLVLAGNSLAIALEPPRTPNLPGARLPLAADDPVSELGVKADGSAVARRFGDWFADRANVRAFLGADLGAQFAAACASLPASGGTIYVPGGRYTSSTALVCNDRPVSVMGDGPGVSVVTFTSARGGQAGLVMGPGEISRSVTIQGLSLITQVDQTNGNAAVRLTYPEKASNIFRGPTVRDLEIAGAGNNETYWANGIDARNVWGYTFEALNVRGRDVGRAAAFPPNLFAAIRLTGTNGSGCADGRITGVNAFFVKHLGYVEGFCEGAHWTDNTGVAVDSGITYTKGTATPGFWIARNHFNSFRYGVNLEGFVQGMVHDNLLYKWNHSAQDYVGIALGANGTYASNNNLVHHNTIYGFAGATPGGEALAVSATASDGNQISSNLFVRTHWGFDFGHANSTNTVTGNTAVGTVKGWQKAVGLNTISANNTPLNVGADQPYVSITRGATTFNVGAWFQRVFHTDNPAAPATLTDFTNAEAGRQITLIAQDARTTVAHNDRIRLKGGVPMVMVPGASLTLLNTGAYWQEVGRSQ